MNHTELGRENGFYSSKCVTLTITSTYNLKLSKQVPNGTSSTQMSVTECLRDTNGNSQASADPLHLSVTDDS